MVYTSTHPPSQLYYEPVLVRPPIKIIARSADNKLDPASRVNLGKVYPVEHNAKVRDLGKVEESAFPRLLADWKTLTLS